MLLSPGKKKMATIIVASMGKKPDYVQNVGEESDTGEYKVPEGESSSMDDMGLVSAAESILKAVKDGKPKALAQAMKDFIYMCDEENSAEGETSGDNNDD